MKMFEEDGLSSEIHAMTLKKVYGVRAKLYNGLFLTKLVQVLALKAIKNFNVFIKKNATLNRLSGVDILVANKLKLIYE